MKVNRKNFLKMLFGGAAATLVVNPARALAEHAFPGHANSKAVLVDLSRCIGCRSCEAACNWQNHLAAPAEPFTSQEVFEAERRTAPEVFTIVNKYETSKGRVFVKRQCMHCQEPACQSVCPVNAFRKTEEGAVVWDQDKCFGCRYCMQACPFWIPKYEFNDPITPRIRKCTFCADRIAKEGGLPACVEACPQEALVFGPLHVIVKEAFTRIAKDPEYVDRVYGNAEFGGTSWIYISKVPFEEIGFQTDVPNEPLPKLTYGFLRTIPIMHTMLPILFAGIYLITRRKDHAAPHDTNGGVR